MIHETAEAGLRGVAVSGPQNVACLAACNTLNTANIEANQEKTNSEDRRTSTSGLSAAVRECRKRVALADIWDALSPVSRHAEASLLCLECEDIEGLDHHLRRVVDGVRRAAEKRRELKALLSGRGGQARQ